MFDTPQRVDALTYMGQFRNDETDNGESNKSVTSHIYSTKVKPGLNGQFLVNYVSLSTNGSGSNGSSHSSIYCLLPTCQPLPSLPPPPAGYSFHNAGECLSLNEMEMVEDY